MRKRRYTETDWIELGLAELSRDGPEALKLEAICKASGLTRGSFYHHFDSHKTYLLALANKWLEVQTSDVVSKVDQSLSVSDQYKALSDAAMSIDYRLELGIRELARRIPEVARVVDEADSTRMDVVAEIYEARFNLTHESAREYAFLEYSAFSGIILINPNIDIQSQRKLAKKFDETIVKALRLKKNHG
ncbi:TetR/AcrR family transcriptional regulator [Cognatishimia sp. MH4019]|uniref:TetR/AcrR family transcriptional regulator n=1 Tax=Cognatishimia sp. MH4019 TaxID=2854030 RepID=UPI001CD7B76B|nr:TetR/AcrR family transcriptional regulator [Cognatishimia sp. MH4019]